MQNKLWTGSFISACIGNFLLFFAFYLLIPILPLFLIEEFNATKSLVGLVLASHTLAALAIRPFSGFLLDLFRRKPQYLLAYLAFILMFVSYPLVNTLLLFLIFRMLHGVAFGYITTAGNSFMVDILPPSRRGEGLGFFGVANTLAMVFGPMTSLMMHDHYSYDTIFYLAIGSGLLGFCFAMMVKAKNQVRKTEPEPISLDRFFLFKGFKAGITLLLIGIPYGMFMTYLAIYGKELGIKSGLGIFFSLMAAGMIVSRMFSGKMVDNGKLNKAIEAGLIISLTGTMMLASFQKLNMVNHELTVVLFYICPVLLGFGYGMCFPAYNTLFVNLAANNRRATASSTFMTSWDIGVGLGLVLGGWFADSKGGLPLAFLVGGLLTVFAYFYFIKAAGPHFLKNKLR
jgi:MFS family permease